MKSICKLPMAAGNWLLATGFWRLAADCWQLAAGNWRLAGGYRLPAVCLCLCLCLCLSETSAQNIPVRKYTMRDGLPGMAIRCLYKDSRGLLWIGTDSGLSTFDGKNFRIFNTAEGMTANRVWSIAEDEEGNMWFGSYGDGLYQYDGQKFTQYTQKNGLADNNIRVLHYSKHFKCLMAGSNTGISTVRNGSITTSPDSIGTREKMYCVTSIFDAGEFVYVTTFGPVGPIRYYPDRNIYVCMNGLKSGYPEGCTFGTLTSGGDTLFASQYYELEIHKKGAVVKIPSVNQIFGVAEDKRGHLWLASWSTAGRDFPGGIFRYDGQSVVNFKSNFGIADKEIWSVLYDNEADILWIGTLNEGLFMVPGWIISEYLPDYFNLNKNLINNLYIDSKERLIITGNRELLRLNNNGTFDMMDKQAVLMTLKEFWTDKRQHPLHPDAIKKFSFCKSEPKLLRQIANEREFNFSGVGENYDHALYFNNEFGLFACNEKWDNIKYLGPENFNGNLVVFDDTLINCEGPNTNIRTDLEIIPDGEYNTLNYPLNKYLHFFNEKSEPGDVNQFIRFKNRTWYASWSSGLWMSKGMQLISFNHRDSTLSDHLLQVTFDKNENLIFSSINKIWIARYHNDSVKTRYTIGFENGLQGNTISWLVPDRMGKLWVGTNSGLNCVDLDTLYAKGTYKISFMDEEEGYTGQSSAKAVIDRKGNIWIAAEEKLIRLETGQFSKQQTAPGKIVLKSMKINYEPSDSILKKEKNPWNIFPAAPFSLKYDQNNLIFSFDILNYLNPGKDRFRIKMKGYDKEWRSWSKERTAAYTNLPPGKYTLSVESYNLYSLLHAAPLEVSFTIRHPWWGLWGVQLAFLMSVLFLAYYFIQKYLKSERKKQQEKAEVDKKIALLEMQALQAQMNPHFVFNCVNGIQYYVLANQMEKVLGYLSDFSNVVRKSLENASLRMVPLDQEMDFLNSYLRLETMRFPDKFDYSVRWEGKEDVLAFMIPPMMVQPFAENAIRHGFMHLPGKGKLTITFEKESADTLKCTIVDNGVGREAAARKRGVETHGSRPHSTSITENRIRLFNPPESPDKFRIVYTDLSGPAHPHGLMVELFLPAETG